MAVTFGNFNTATFFILTAFITHMQIRNKKINYFSWIISKWFGIIPLSLLALLMCVPSMHDSTSGHYISVGTQVYLWVMNFMGFSWLGSAGNFAYLHNETAFNLDSNFGDVGTLLDLVFNSNYFA